MVQAEYTGLQNLYAMISYCINQSKCRRYMVAHHFGEIWREEDCDKMCDICLKRKSTDPIKEDATLISEGFMEVLEDAQKIDQRVTAAKLVDLWKSSPVGKKFSNPRPTVKKLELILSHCLMNGIIQEDYHFTPFNTISYIVLGPKAYAIKTKRLSVVLESAVFSSLDVAVAYPIGKVYPCSSGSSLLETVTNCVEPPAVASSSFAKQVIASSMPLSSKELFSPCMFGMQTDTMHIQYLVFCIHVAPL